MTTPDYSIAAVASSDLPTLARFIHDAKLALSINRLIFLDWPNEPVQSRQYTSAVQSGYDDPSIECFKAVDNHSQEIIGYFVLGRKRSVEKTPPIDIKNDDSKADVPEGLNPALLAEVVNATSLIARETEDIDRYELIYMCVKPALQRQGIGSELVRLGFERAQAEGIPLAVCAEAPAYKFFAKLGFKETTHVDIDLRNYAPANTGFGIFRLTGMIWRP
ncbi:uncharacterized protein N7459_000261 [Penicillium hispanicum]|uniref:uncharacterized protein n=1 Tax=Penicillium hispanicum TaxID=1080232 RepID=UPI0025414EF5|nr:uncharacterized protein N7459_000261 [Penicillium hispanicum]KAJ5594053.1 hypothetical protein N7459_000261 [Penicillium hispanicum]